MCVTCDGDDEDLFTDVCVKFERYLGQNEDDINTFKEKATAESLRGAALAQEPGGVVGPLCFFKPKSTKSTNTTTLLQLS